MENKNQNTSSQGTQSSKQTSQAAGGQTGSSTGSSFGQNQAGSKQTDSAVGSSFGQNQNSQSGSQQGLRGQQAGQSGQAPSDVKSYDQESTRATNQRGNAEDEVGSFAQKGSRMSEGSDKVSADSDADTEQQWPASGSTMKRDQSSTNQTTGTRR